MPRSKTRDIAAANLSNIRDGIVVTDDFADGIITTDKVSNEAVLLSNLSNSIIDAKALKPINLTFDSAQELDVGTYNLFNADSTGGVNTTLSFTNVPAAGKWMYTVKHGTSGQDLGFEDSTAYGLQYNGNTFPFAVTPVMFRYRFVPGNNGNRLFYSNFTNGTIQQIDFGTPYDLTTLDSASVKQFGIYFVEPFINARGPVLHPKGEKLFLSGYATSSLYSLTLGTSWDISTADSASLSTFNSTELGAPSTAGGAMPEFSLDGTKMYLTKYGTGASDNIIYQYTLSTPWDITTATYDSKSFNMSQNLFNAGHYGFSFTNNEGTKAIATNVFGGVTQGLTLSTGYDISTASKVDSVNIESIINDPTFNPNLIEFGAALPADSGDYKYMYVGQPDPGRIFRIEMPASSVQSTLTLPASVKNSLSATPSTNNPQQIIEFVTYDSGTNVYITNDLVASRS